MSVTRLFGASVKRREDPRLITGRARFTDDFKLPGMLHMAMLRSPYAPRAHHRLDVTQGAANAWRARGHHRQGSEGKVNPMPCAWLIPDSDLKVPAYRALVSRYRCASPAMAWRRWSLRDPAVARDALDLIDVDYEPLPVVTTQEQAGPLARRNCTTSAPGNQAFHWKFANGDADAATAAMPRCVIKQRFVQQRLIPNAMEPRGAVAAWNPGAEELTLYNTTQNPHIARFLIAVTNQHS